MATTAAISASNVQKIQVAAVAPVQRVDGVGLIAIGSGCHGWNE
jgi:hypothetical protein